MVGNTHVNTGDPIIKAKEYTQNNIKGLENFFSKPLILLVGGTGFEPVTSTV